MTFYEFWLSIHEAIEELMGIRDIEELMGIKKTQINLKTKDN